jgi:type III restriction enzyme
VLALIWCASSAIKAILFSLKSSMVKAFSFSYETRDAQAYIKPQNNIHLAFHMATGSGKTVMMAGLILYLYEQDYRNFLFFVNRGQIVVFVK